MGCLSFSHCQKTVVHLNNCFPKNTIYCVGMCVVFIDLQFMRFLFCFLDFWISHDSRNFRLPECDSTCRKIFSYFELVQTFNFYLANGDPGLHTMPSRNLRIIHALYFLVIFKFREFSFTSCEFQKFRVC